VNPASSANRGADFRNASRPGPKKILVVDENDVDLREIGVELRNEGCEVIAARSGAEALELLSAQLVDCILLGMQSRHLRASIQSNDYTNTQFGLLPLPDGYGRWRGISSRH
jgi:hypothetical protein